jgi:hypothetical protein
VTFSQFDKRDVIGDLVAFLFDDIEVSFGLIQNGLDLYTIISDLLDPLDNDFWLHGPFQFELEFLKL